MKNTENIDSLCEEIIHKLNSINVLLINELDPIPKMYQRSVQLMLKDVHLSIMRHYYRQDVDNANYQINTIDNE
jgi:uncharacterized protein YfkK (UPF0435 family)